MEQIFKPIAILCCIVFTAGIGFFGYLLYFNPNNEFLHLLLLTSIVGLLAYWVLFKFERSA